jgi:hypothetical protein
VLTPVKPSMLREVEKTVLIAIVLTFGKVVIFTSVKAVFSC